MKDDTELQKRIKSRAAKKLEQRKLRTLTFAAIFVSLIIAVFFMYDIVLSVIAAAEKEPEQPSTEITEPEYSESEIVRYPIEDFIVSDRKSFLVHLYADGKYYSCAYSTDQNKTVRDLLYRFSVFLGEDDETNYSVDTPLSEDMLVKVGRITYEYLTETVTIPYTTEEIPVIYSVFADKFEIGVPTEGENGIKTIQSRITYVDGVKVENIVISQKITKKPVAGVKYVDYSYQLEKGSGTPSSYVRKLDCEFTSYTYIEDGGLVTYTGDKTRVGYVAVDPKVIPLYSKLYIVLDNGFVYGYCYAMDTGGAIKGNRIDLFLPSIIDANQLGRRGGTVYIIREGKGD